MYIENSERLDYLEFMLHFLYTYRYIDYRRCFFQMSKYVVPLG